MSNENCSTLTWKVSNFAPVVVFGIGFLMHLATGNMVDEWYDLLYHTDPASNDYEFVLGAVQLVLLVVFTIQAFASSAKKVSTNTITKGKIDGNLHYIWMAVFGLCIASIYCFFIDPGINAAIDEYNSVFYILDEPWRGIVFSAIFGMAGTGILMATFFSGQMAYKTLLSYIKS